MREFKIVIAFLLLYILPHTLSFVRFTKFDCHSYNKSWVIINECRLRAIDREISKFYMNVTVLNPAHNIWVNLVFLKRETRGYETALGWNYTFDACEYLIRKNQPVMNMFFRVFRRYTNLNHTCPYYGDQIVNGFSMHEVFLNLPFANGDYAVWFIWEFNRAVVLHTKGYFELKF